MKSYSLELVQRRTNDGLLGKVLVAALVGAGAYLGYKKLTEDKTSKDFSDVSGSSYDSQAHEGEDFTDRILRAAKRIID
ncbi:MAG: hypothetical protein FWB75_01095 [Oscillospiraceae bacterium]|nr:hypothetical protein [Oscillospiraceae bacterium]